MIKFNTVVLHNFGSYRHTELDFSDKGFCLVSGENKYKQDNALSNGSGKSFIWNAICFAICGETLTGLKNNLKNINVDEDLSYVKLSFSFDKDFYEIDRQIAPKSDLKIQKNGIDVSGKGIRESEKRLADLLPDITKDFLASTIILGQGMPNKFSSFSPSGRKELLEKLTKSDFMIEDVKRRVQERATELNNRHRILEDSQLVHKTQMQQLNKQLQDIKSELTNTVCPDFEKEISAKTTFINKISTEINAELNEISKLESQIEELNKQIIYINSEKSKAIVEELNGYNTNITESNSNKVVIETNISALKHEISHLKSITDICPTCKQKLPGVKKPDTSQKEQLLETYKSNLNSILGIIEKHKIQHEENTKKINEAFDYKLNQLNNSFTDSKKTLGTRQTNYQSLNYQLSVQKEELTKLIFTRDNWKKHVQSLENKAVELETTINKTANMLSLVEADLLDVTNHCNALKKIETLIKRDFRGYLLENIIKYIDAKAKEYCKIVFETTALNVFLDNNSLSITYGGKIFDGLSGGEKQRVDLILQFAIRDMLNKYLNMSSNILVLDEITDFLDAKSCEAVMRLIENELSTVESVFIISHHVNELKIPADSTLTVVKDEEGISAIY